MPATRPYVVPPRDHSRMTLLVELDGESYRKMLDLMNRSGTRTFSEVVGNSIDNMHRAIETRREQSKGLIAGGTAPANDDESLRQNLKLDRLCYLEQAQMRLNSNSDANTEDSDFAYMIGWFTRNGISSSELAVHFGVSPPTVSRWAEGRNLPRSPTRQHVFQKSRELLGRMVQAARAEASPT